MSLINQHITFKSLEDTVVLNKPKSLSHYFKSNRYSESLVHTSIVTNAVVFADSKEAFMNQMLTLFPRLQSQSEIWIVYPKTTRKKELSQLHQELNWDFLGDYRLQPVRQIDFSKQYYAIKLKKVEL